MLKGVEVTVLANNQIRKRFAEIGKLSEHFYIKYCTLA